MQYNLGRFILKPRGAYDTTATYDKLDIVLYLGSSYVCKSNGVSNTLPTDATYWQLLAVAGEATLTEEMKQEIIASLVASGVVVDTDYNTFTAAEKQKLQGLTAPNNGTLTLNYGGRRLATFSADQSNNTTANIPAPSNAAIKFVNDTTGTTIGDFRLNESEDKVIRIPVGSGGGASVGTLTLQQGGTTIGTFSGTDATLNILNQSLTIQKNGTTITTYNPRTTQTCNIIVPTNVSDLLDGGEYPTYRGLTSELSPSTADALDGDCVIRGLQPNYIYHCTNVTALGIVSYGYTATEPKSMINPATYIFVETANNNVDIDLRELGAVELIHGSSLRLNAGTKYLITVIGYVWRVEALDDLQ